MPFTLSPIPTDIPITENPADPVNGQLSFSLTGYTTPHTATWPNKNGTVAFLDDIPGSPDLSGYVLLAGRAGGQSIRGGTAASEDLTLSSTFHATKGKILFGTSAYDEVNNRLGIGTASPSYKLQVEGSTYINVGSGALGFLFDGMAASNSRMLSIDRFTFQSLYTGTLWEFNQGSTRLLSITDAGVLAFGVSQDVCLQRDAADTLALKRTTNRQAIRVYGRYVDASNYGYGELACGTGVGGYVQLKAVQAGTGGANGIYYMGDYQIFTAANGTEYCRIHPGVFFPATTNTFDLGATAYLFRSLYLGTSLFAPAIGCGSVAPMTVPAQVGVHIVHDYVRAIHITQSTLGVAASDGAYIGYSVGFYVWNQENSDFTLGTNNLECLRFKSTGEVEIRDGTNAKTFRVYNTYTDASNYQRLVIGHSGGNVLISTENAGTGGVQNLGLQASQHLSLVAAATVFISSASVARWAIDGGYYIGNGHLVPVTTNTYDLGGSSYTVRNVYAGTAVINSGYYETAEMTAPAAPSANGVRIYAEDNGAGKTRLMAVFASGAAQQIAIEP